MEVLESNITTLIKRFWSASPIPSIIFFQIPAHSICLGQLLDSGEDKLHLSDTSDCTLLIKSSILTYLADDLHRERVAFSLKKWFTENYQFFED